MSATELETELDERTRLAAKYPDWHLWVSRSDRSWATRRGNIAPPLGSDYPKDPRWRMTIDADTWPELEEVLKQQTDLDAGMLTPSRSISSTPRARPDPGRWGDPGPCRAARPR
jgi:hypothetical protein